MVRPIKIALFTAALIAGPLAAGQPAKAERVVVDVGGIAFGYNDGYWDRAHRWHRWRNHREAEAWRAANADHYYAWRHDRDRDHGWRDERWWERR